MLLGGIDARGDRDSYKMASSGFEGMLQLVSGYGRSRTREKRCLPLRHLFNLHGPLESELTSSLGNKADVLKNLELLSLLAPGPEGALLFGD